MMKYSFDTKYFARHLNPADWLSRNVHMIETNTHTANVLAVNSTFYFCVKNPPTVSCDFSRYLSVVYQDQYSALFTEK